jgi:hypothetical protein
MLDDLNDRNRNINRNRNILDYLIIGGGMAGLYMGLHLQRKGVSFNIVEKDFRLGGRAWTEPFAGVDISPGAGIGRRRKDKCLMALMTKLNIPLRFFRIQHYFSEKLSQKISGIDVSVELAKLADAFISQQPRTTFREFATQIWGREVYKKFILLNGYTDMENEDIEQTLMYYGLDDNLEKGWQGFSVPWANLVGKMAFKIGYRRIHTGQPVVHVQRTQNGFIISTPTQIYRCRNVVFATPTRVIQRLLPQYSKMYALIPDQPFLRIYVQFDPVSSEILKNIIQGTTIVSNLLQKIIPIQKDKGVYMIAYSDNAHALHGKSLSRSDISDLVREEFKLEQKPRILEMKKCFWEVGTHYYKPLPQPLGRKEFIHWAQHPEPNIYVVGESVSLNQGWVEGALESVEKLKII